MDMTVARMNSTQRATLIHILNRGLASLTKAERTGSTVDLVDRLTRVLAETPQLDRHSAQTVALLAFAPRGLRLAGVQVEVLNELIRRGHIRPRGTTRHVITFQGWQTLWESGQAQQMLDAMTE